MNQPEVSEIVAILTSVYRPADFPPERVEIYERLLVELDRDKLEQAVLRLVKTHEFPPTPAAIFAEYSIVEQGRQLESGEALALVFSAIRYVGSYRPMPTTGRYALPDRVQRTVAALGGWEQVCLHDHEESFRSKFLDVYSSLSRVDGDDRAARSTALPENAKAALRGMEDGARYGAKDGQRSGLPEPPKFN